MADTLKVLQFPVERVNVPRAEPEVPAVKTYRLKPEVRALLKHYAAGRIPERYLREGEE